MSLRKKKNPRTVADEVNNRIVEMQSLLNQCGRDLKRGDRIDMIDGFNFLVAQAKQATELLRSTIPGSHS